MDTSDLYGINCDDDEDCVAGSGSGDGPLGGDPFGIGGGSQDGDHSSYNYPGESGSK